MITDYSKYKRIFAFGCSFTCYSWPTWADLISLEAPHAVYSNYGKAGMGNLGISVRIIEASKRFNFTSDDLILVMWTTFCREDRWLRGNWFTQGNVYASTYPKDWVQEYTDPFGYKVRDHALIYSTTQYLKSLECDSILLKSSPFAYIEGIEDSDVADYESLGRQLEFIYKKDYDEMPIDFYTSMGNIWNKGPEQEFLDDWDKDKKPRWRKDRHPWTTEYLNYLNFIGIKLSDNTKKFAIESDLWMSRKPRVTEMHEKFNFLRQNVAHQLKLF
jgi:hypothetical protein